MAARTPFTALAAPNTRRWGDTATVALIVGATRTTFQVHETVLFEASPVFKAAFNSHFKESVERTMYLPDDDADIFNLMVEWLYSHRFHLPPPTGEEPYDGNRFMQPMQLYVLADKYEVTRLKNTIARTIFTTLQDRVICPNMTTVAYAYRNLPPTSGMRKLLADLYACNIGWDWYEGANLRYLTWQHPEFTADVLLSFTRHIKRKHVRNPFEGDMPEAYEE